MVFGRRVVISSKDSNFYIFVFLLHNGENRTVKSSMKRDSFLPHMMARFH